jgi:transposase
VKDLSVHVLLSEVGPDLSAFPTEGDSASWLGLCPNLHITEGQVLSSHTGKVRNRSAYALGMAAQSLEPSQSHLEQLYRRKRAKHGPVGAITVTAHKLARILYHLLKTHQPYDESVFAPEEECQRLRAKFRPEKQAKALGFELVPVSVTTT